jgi:hypothetical protein
MLNRTPALPPLLGDGRYRLFTATHAPFDTFPPPPHPRPALVTVDPWGVSYAHLNRLFSSPSVVAADDGLVTLHAYRPDGPRRLIHHELDGTRYPTVRDAQRAAYDAGLLAFMVYERKVG